MSSRREVVLAVNQAITSFEKEFLGRGPLEVKTHIIEDMVLVRLKGVLTPAELQLVNNTQTQPGHSLVKEMRQRLIEIGRPLLDQVMQDIIGREVVSLHTDVSTKTGERIIVFVFDGVLEFTD